MRPRLATTNWGRLADFNLPYAPTAPKALRAPRLNKAAKAAKPLPPGPPRLLFSNRPAA
jgi:hypothetical protein